MQASPALYLIVVGCIWLGAMTFIAAISIYYPDILLHGNPIGIRCVLASTGAIVGLPVGFFLHQIYSNCKAKISADLLLNAWIGLIIPILLSNLILGFCNLIQQFLLLSPYNFAEIWGVTHFTILLWLGVTVSKDQNQVIHKWSPSFYETMHMVQAVLTPAKRRILDLRFVIRHQMMALACTGFLEGSWILTMATVDQLRVWSLHKSARIQHRSQRTLASLNCFQNSYSEKLFVSLRNYPKQWGPIRTILGESIRADTRLVLTNYAMMWSTKKKGKSSSIVSALELCSNRLSISSEDSLFLPTWAQALQSPYQPGDWLELSILGRGRLPYQGQSHLEDGSLVFITKGAPYIGQKVRVQVVQILHSVTGFVIFAHLPSAPQRNQGR